MKIVIDSELNEYNYLHKKILDGTISLSEKKRYEVLSEKLRGVEEVKVRGKQF